MPKQKKIKVFDIGGTNVISALAYDGHIFDVSETPIDVSVGSKSIIKIIKDELSTNHDFSGISISAPGVIDVTTGIVVACTDTIKNYKGLNYFKELQDYGVPIVIDNDLNCAALGEYENSSCHSIYQINIGTGIGGSFIKDGVILKGVDGIAGEVGYLKVKNTSLDDLMSTRGLVDRVRIYNQEIRNGKDVIANLNQSDIEKEFIGFCNDIAGLLSIIYLVTNPDKIIIGGGISESQVLVEYIADALDNYLPHAIKNKIVLEAASLGNMAGIHGAVLNYKIRTEEQ